MSLACCADVLETNTSTKPISAAACEAGASLALIPGHASCSAAKATCDNRPAATSYAAALSYCQAQDLRLCTLSELSVVAAMDDASACQPGYFWTSTDCSRAGQAAAMAQYVPYEPNPSHNPSTCSGARWGRAYVTCCADSTQVQLWRDPVIAKPTPAPSGADKGHASRNPLPIIIGVLVILAVVVVAYVVVRRKQRKGAVAVSTLDPSSVS